MKTKRDLSGLQSVLAFGLTLLLALLYAVIVCVSPSFETTEKGARIITINTFVDTVFLAALPTVAISFCVAIWLLICKVKKGWLLLGSVLISPIVGFIGITLQLISHHDVASVEDVDGTKYHLLIEHFLQGSDVVISKLESRSPFRSRFKVLGRSAWETYVFVVRKASNDKLEDFQLYISPTHKIVAVTSENRACLAYDLRNKWTYADEYNNAEHRTSPIVNLSPFELLSNSDQASNSDFKTLFAVEGNTYIDSRPEIKALASDLNSPNLLVREMARKLKVDLLAHPPIHN